MPIYQSIYTQQIYGGIGLIGNPQISGFLFSSIIGLEPVSSQDLVSLIVGKENNQTSTESGNVLYSHLILGKDIGLLGITSKPDLLGSIVSKGKIQEGEEDLLASIRGTLSGSSDLISWYRLGFSEDFDLGSTISGNHIFDLIAAIRPKQSGSLDLEAEIEPIPPVDLSGTLIGYPFLDLTAHIDCIEPVSLSGSLYAIQRLDLNGNIVGYDQQSLSGSIEGIFEKDIIAGIRAINSGILDLSGQLRGLLGQDVEKDLFAHLTSITGQEGTITGELLAVSKLDLDGYIETLWDETISGEIYGDMPGGLSGTITATGGLGDLYGHITPSRLQAQSLLGYIEGIGVQDLYGTIETDNDRLIGKISGTGADRVSQLYGNLVPFYPSDLIGEYLVEDQNIIKGLIDVIPPSNLQGVITPKVYYLESSIPINTYPVYNLKAVINADYCGYSSQLQDLYAIIVGITGTNLEASIVGVAGEYVLASDQLPIVVKNIPEIADYLLLIADQPAFTEDYIQLIITQAPIYDLVGTIIGTPNESSLSGSITPVYIPPVSRAGVELGQLVNTLTGDRKLIKMYFRGDINNFYYSVEGNKTYPEYTSDYLEIVIETYEVENPEFPNSLLARKINVKKCRVSNLESFENIDSAIKYGIMCAAGQIQASLSAFIQARGLTSDLSTSISGLDSRKLKDLSGGITAVGNLPDISGTYNPSGGLDNLLTTINAVQSSFTYSNFVDSTGFSYKPQLILLDNNEYAVVLTKLSVSGTVNLSTNPDIGGYIDGTINSDVDASISGTL